MDFIEGLPSSGSIDCVLIVFDWLTKYGHVLGLRHPFTAKEVAVVCVHDIVRLHGVPSSIVSDCDKIFLDSFWSELFLAMGNKIQMSSAYYPETDGQPEVVN